MGFPGADRPGFRCASLEQPGAGSQHTTGAVLIHRSELLGHPGLRAAALGPHGPRTALRRTKWKRRARIPRLVHIAGIVVGNDARQPCLSVCLSV